MNPWGGGQVELEGGGEVVTWDDDAPVVGLEVRPFNWRLRRAREARGWSRAELARRVGLSPTTVGRAEQLRPIGAQARWDMALTLGVPEDVLFPGEVDKLLDDGPRRIEVPILRDDMAALLGGDTKRDIDVEERGALAVLQTDALTALEALTGRERRVMELRCGIGEGASPMTCDEVGEVIGVTRERVRQIEARALRKLRHPTQSHPLREYVWAPFETLAWKGDRKSRCMAEQRGDPACHTQFVPPGWMFEVPLEDIRKPMAWCERCFEGFLANREGARALFLGRV